MTKETIWEVVKKLTGECYPYGSHSIDQDRYENLMAKIYVASALLDEIEEAGRLYNRSEFSILTISNRANEFLTEIRDCLNDVEYLPPLADMRGEEE